MSCLSKDQIFPILPGNCTSQLDIDDVLILLYKALVLLSWAAEVMAIFLLIWAAVIYFTSAGDEAKMSTAKKIVAAVVGGVLIVLLARWFLYIVIANIAATPNDVNINALTD